MWIRRRFETALVVGLAAASAQASGPGPVSSATAPSRDGSGDALAQFRQRFKLGMDRYKEGALSDAIAYWEPLYRELGPTTGYRLAYNLGVAYAELGDATRAAERLQAFLSEVDGRRASGQAVGPVVTKEETDARQRVAMLVESKGRIRTHPMEPPVVAQVDADEPRVTGFTEWVAPGLHTVRFAPGTAHEEVLSVQVGAGHVVDVEPAAVAVDGGEAGLVDAAGDAPADGFVERPQGGRLARPKAGHPFSPALPMVAGGVTIAATVAAVALELQANHLHDQFASEQANTRVIVASDRDAFNTTRTWAYVAVGGAVGAAALTAGLTAWYFWGSTRRELVPTVSLDGTGVGVRVQGRF
jgi:hypothetical protein